MLVFVVEDEVDIREALTECLSGDGFDVFAFANGREALEALEVVRPGVILLDLLMCDMDGWTFRREQKKRPAVAEIPVIVMTGLPLAEAAAKIDAAAFVSKPFTMEALTATILMLTRSCRGRSQGRRCGPDSSGDSGHGRAAAGSKVISPV